MYKRAIHGYFILLACLMVRLACAQNSALSAASLPEPLPVMHGYINGVKAVAQGDLVAFFAGRQPVPMDEGCDDDLNCVMQKYCIDVVAVNNKGVLLVPQNNNIHKETSDISDFIFPSQTLNTLTIEPTCPQAVFISTQQSEITPAPASFTLHTGIPVVGQTPALAFINSETTSLLANTIITVNLLSASGRFTESFTQVEPTPTHRASVFPTVTVEAESISGLLASIRAVPALVEIEQNELAENREEQSVVRLKTTSEILEVRPTPTHTSTDSGRGQWTFTVRQLLNTASGSSSTPYPEATPAVGKSDHDNQNATSQCESDITERIKMTLGAVSTDSGCTKRLLLGSSNCASQPKKVKQELGLIRVGTIKYVGGKKIFPEYKDFKRIEVMTPSTPYGSIGPYCLKNEKGQIFENIWQAHKFYKDVPEICNRYSRYNRRVIWEHPKEVHVDEEGNPNANYWKWREKLMNNKDAVRYPVGYTARKDCLGALWENDEGEFVKLNWVDARKKIYIPYYTELVVKTEKFNKLTEMLKRGDNLLILEVDGPREESLEYYKEQYGVSNDFIVNRTIAVTPENMGIMLHDKKHPFGHGYCLAMALRAIRISQCILRVISRHRAF